MQQVASENVAKSQFFDSSTKVLPLWWQSVLGNIVVMVQIITTTTTTLTTTDISNSSNRIIAQMQKNIEIDDRYWKCLGSWKKRFFSSQSSPLMVIHGEVQDALHNQIVALESNIIAHGMPYPTIYSYHYVFKTYYGINMSYRPPLLLKITIVILVYRESIWKIWHGRDEENEPQNVQNESCHYS